MHISIVFITVKMSKKRQSWIVLLNLQTDFRFHFALRLNLEKQGWGFPDCPVVKTLPSKAGGVGLNFWSWH